jgi:hypothetical protein
MPKQCKKFDGNFKLEGVRMLKKLAPGMMNVGPCIDVRALYAQTRLQLCCADLQSPYSGENHALSY